MPAAASGGKLTSSWFFLLGSSCSAAWRGYNFDKIEPVKNRTSHSDTRFLDDGLICLTNNAGERAHRCIPLSREAWQFCGSDRGSQRAAIIYPLIQTAKLNNVDRQA